MNVTSKMLLMYPSAAATNFSGYEGVAYTVGPGCVDVEPADIAMALRNGWVQVPQPPDGTMMQRSPDGKTVIAQAQSTSAPAVTPAATPAAKPAAPLAKPTVQ